MIEIRTLGTLSVRSADGRELHSLLAQPKRMALLAYLCHAMPRGFQRRDSLVALFWPEADSTHARGALRKALHVLRGYLGDESILTRGEDEVAVSRDHVRCDAVAFQDLASAGDFAGALALYQGELLPSFFVGDAPGFEEWLDQERSRLRTLAADCAKRLADRLEPTGDIAGAIAALSRSLALIADERTVRRLLALLERAGDRAAAITAYESFERQLAASAGIAPSAETESLIARIRGPAASPGKPVRVESAPDAGSGFPAVSHGRRRRFGSRAMTGLSAVAAIALAFTVPDVVKRYRAADPDHVAVLPFRVSGDSSLRYLREAAVDVHALILTGEGVPLAVDVSKVLRAYRRATRQAGGELSLEQSLALARGLGAERAVVGEVVAVPGRITATSRLVDVHTGKVIARHSEWGASDEVRLVRRLAVGLFAKSIGESRLRLSGMTDSAEAARAYLAGLQSSRAARHSEAFAQFGRALEIDPTFAAAALWRARVGWGAFVFGESPIRAADSVAWSLRDRLPLRDRVILQSSPSIGPNYPRPSTLTDMLRAKEAAARVHGDRPEVLTDWAQYLFAFGRQAGLPERSLLARAAALLDSALVLDSTFVLALRGRVSVALSQRDTLVNRHHERLLRMDSLARPDFPIYIGRFLGDTAQVERGMAACVRTWSCVNNVYLWHSQHGDATPEDAQRLTEQFLLREDVRPAQRGMAQSQLMRLAASRGESRRARLLADSTTGWFPLVSIAFAEAGYADIAERAVKFQQARADTARPPQKSFILCQSSLWRAARGDSLGVRAVADWLDRYSRQLDPAQAMRVGPLGLCPLMVYAALEQRAGTSNTRALRRVQRLLLEGTTELPFNLGHLLVAQWLEARGEHREALDIVQRRGPMAGWDNLVQPALWRMEARLSAITGDTARAIHAYQRFLQLRDRPDTETLVAEVDSARAHLARLSARSRPDAAR